MGNIIRPVSSKIPNPAKAVRNIGTYGKICHIEHCQMPTEADVHIPLCRNHLRKAWAAYLVVDDDGPDRRLADRDVISDDAKGFVYFMRIGEVIKIGWSHDPYHRAGSLNADAILHTQVGTRQDERALHGLFHHLLDHGKEWFKAEPELLDYIKELHTQAA